LAHEAAYCDFHGNDPCHGRTEVTAGEFPSAYPEAERLELVEEIHRQPVADPDRWLEE
jgi:hypothetical protein